MNWSTTPGEIKEKQLCLLRFHYTTIANMRSRSSLNWIPQLPTWGLPLPTPRWYYKILKPTGCREPAVIFEDPANEWTVSSMMFSALFDTFLQIHWLTMKSSVDFFFQLYNEDPLTEFHRNWRLYRKFKAFGLFKIYSFDKPVELHGIFWKQMNKSEKV